MIKSSMLKDKKIFNEIEVYELLKKFDISVPVYYYMPYSDGKDKERFIENALKINSEKVVIKMVSSKNLHKTDSGGVKIVKKDKDDIALAFDKISSIDAEGIAAVEFLEHSPALGEEILVGVKYDDAFGYILMIGPGGTYTERFIKSVRKEYLPEFLSISEINEVKLTEFINKSWTLDFVLGRVRGVSKKCEMNEVLKTLKGFINIVKKFAEENITIEELEVNPFIITSGRMYAADGVLRLKKSSQYRRKIPTDNALYSLTSPRTVAFCGVSEKKQNMARIILNNTINSGFPKQNMYVIKEGVNEIDGVKAYASVKDVREKIDMYVVSVPVDGVKEVLDEAAESGKVNGVVLITGGVGEKSGTENIQRDIINIIEKGKEINPDFALNGGNCMGIVLNRSHVNTFFIPEYKMQPLTGKNPYMVPTAFISQSGAFVISTLTKIPHIKCDYIITTGNQQDVTVVDYLDYFSRSDIKLVLAYIEGLKERDGERLLNILRKMKENGKLAVIYKAGRTSFGQKAVMGHTASIAGDYVIFEKLIKDAGAVVCESFDEFCDMACLASYALNYNIKTNRAFFISNAGFETTGMGDSISVLEPYGGNELKDRIEDILKKFRLDSIVDFKNPMDVTPMAGDDALGEIIETLYFSGLYSVIFISPVPLTPAMNSVECEKSPDRFERSFINKIASLNNEKKIFMPICVASGSLYDPYVEYAKSKGFVVFRSADRMIRCFEKYYITISRR